MTTLLTGLREQPRVLIPEGPPGIGKTTVWRSALDDARPVRIHGVSIYPTGAILGKALQPLRHARA